MITYEVKYKPQIDTYSIITVSQFTFFLGKKDI